MFRIGESVRDDICIKDFNVYGIFVLRYMIMVNEIFQFLIVIEVSQIYILIGDDFYKNYLVYFDKVEISIRL